MPGRGLGSAPQRWHREVSDALWRNYSAKARTEGSDPADEARRAAADSRRRRIARPVMLCSGNLAHLPPTPSRRLCKFPLNCETGRRGTGPGTRKAECGTIPPERDGGPDSVFPRWPPRPSPPHD